MNEQGKMGGSIEDAKDGERVASEGSTTWVVYPRDSRDIRLSSYSQGLNNVIANPSVQTFGVPESAKVDDRVG